MFALIALLLLQPAAQETPPPDPAVLDRLDAERAEAAERARAAEAEAARLAAEIAGLQARLVAAGRRVEAGERAASGAEARLYDLAEEEAAILARLAADRERLADVLAALQRIERGAPPALAIAPGDAAESARAAALLAEIAPALRDRADALAAELDALRAVRSRTETERRTLSGAETALAAERAEIEALIEQRRILESGRRDEARRQADVASAAGREADSLRELLGVLQRMAAIEPRLNPRRVEAAAAATPEPVLRPAPGELLAALAPAEPLETLRFADAHGRLRPPVAGAVVRRFGQPNPDGDRTEGLLIRARNLAQVVAPFDARIEYAGPFGSYGGLLILDVGDDYYIVLAGMAAVYAEAGQSVLAGEPVGAMSTGGDAAPDLYMEIWRGREAIDPEPWLRPDARS